MVVGEVSLPSLPGSFQFGLVVGEVILPSLPGSLQFRLEVGEVSLPSLPGSFQFCPEVGEVRRLPSQHLRPSPLQSRKCWNAYKIYVSY